MVFGGGRVFEELRGKKTERTNLELTERTNQPTRWPQVVLRVSSRWTCGEPGRESRASYVT